MSTKTLGSWKLGPLLAIVALNAGLAASCSKEETKSPDTQPVIDEPVNPDLTLPNEFQAAAEMALEVAKVNPELGSKVDVAALEASVTSAKVSFFSHPMYYNGRERDAVSFPRVKKIYVNRVRWKELTEQEKFASALQAHLQMIGVDDADRAISDLMLEINPETKKFYTNRVEILFVIANNRGMAEHQQALARAAESLFNTLVNRGVDFQIGVSTTETYTKKGELFGQNKFITPLTTNGAEELAENFKVGTFGYSTYFFEAVPLVFAPGLLKGVNKGFLRSRSNLEIILIGDSDDTSYSKEGKAMLEELKALKGNKGKVGMSAVFPLRGDTQCLSEGFTESSRILKFAKDTGFNVDSLCKMDEAYLESLANKIADRLYGVTLGLGPIVM